MSVDCLSVCFPRAAEYARFCEDAFLREALPDYFPWTERHLQCVWADDRLRPANLETGSGERLEIEFPGRWNLEAGPDFMDAVFLIGPEKRRVTGDVEIHVRPEDWARHGHSSDRRYDRVRFHVTYFPPRGKADTAAFPSPIVLGRKLAENREFHFEDLDVTAYPFEIPVSSTPCVRLLAGLSFDAKRELLESAGEERLRRKAQRLQEALRSRTPEQVFYEEMMVALGYKHNKGAFRLLARTAEVHRLPPDDRAAFAVLCGTAGLLPHSPDPEWEPETRAYFRELWSLWFRVREQWTERGMTAESWRLSNLRPMNHPLRRLAAAAFWFSGNRLFSRLEAVDAAAPRVLIGELLEVLEQTDDRFWSRHCTWNSRAGKPSALVGAARARAMLVNVLIPWFAVRARCDLFESGLLPLLPAEELNSVMRETAARLFGPDHPPKLYRSELARQGLIQIFQDHCLSSRMQCGECRLAHSLAESAG